jgi:SulP family sulfate permease
MSALDRISGTREAIILYLGQVPAIDATGLVALETTVDKLKRAGHKVILAGMKPQVADVVARSTLQREKGKLALAPDLDAALSLALIHTVRT